MMRMLARLVERVAKTKSRAREREKDSELGRKEEEEEEEGDEERTRTDNVQGKRTSSIECSLTSVEVSVTQVSRAGWSSRKTDRPSRYSRYRIRVDYDLLFFSFPSRVSSACPLSFFSLSASSPLFLARFEPVAEPEATNVFRQRDQNGKKRKARCLVLGDRARSLGSKNSTRGLRGSHNARWYAPRANEKSVVQRPFARRLCTKKGKRHA